MQIVDVIPHRHSEAFAAIIGPDRAGLLAEEASRVHSILAGRRVLNINATASGGGVAEMLEVLLATVQSLGVETGWYVLDGNAEFFAITKRIHNLIHGNAGDGGPLGDAERECFDSVLADNLSALSEHVRPGDVMICHDPQTAGLIPGLKELGVKTVWRSHIGKDEDDYLTDRAWEFLQPYITQADALVLTRPTYAPPYEMDMPIHIIPPSIDPLAPKNRQVAGSEVVDALVRAGLIEGDREGAEAHFLRRGDEPGEVRAHSGLVLDENDPIPADARLVLQVSRWDALKDMPGVVQGFVDVIDQLPQNAHVALVGPATEGVSDDPEGAQVLEDCRAMRQALPEEVRRRVHLIALPMDDVDENAHLVNCLQRWAAIVVQKSLVEGFGLTVTEAMWKARPMIASKVGGIQDQIDHRVDGLLLSDPTDLAKYGGYVVELLGDTDLADRLARRAHERVLTQFLGDRHLRQYGTLLEELLA